MKKVFFSMLLLLLPAACLPQNGYIHGNGDPSALNPVPNCGASRFYIDDSTGKLYTAAQGSPCAWTAAGGSTPPTAATISSAVAAPSGLVIFGDSISCGTGVTSYLDGFAYLLRGQVGGNYTNFCRSGDQEADQNWQRIFSATNPIGGGLDPVFISETGTNDSIVYGSNVNQQYIFLRAKLGSMSWLSIPSSLKVLGQAATKTGTWAVDNTLQLGVAEQSATNNSTLSFTVTTTAANQAAYLWYMILDGNGGTFTVKLDGTTQNDPYNGTTTFYAAGDSSSTILTQNAVKAAVAGARVPIASAGTHTIVVNVTSTTNAANIVSIYGVGLSPASTSTLNPYVVAVTPNHQNSANDAMSGTYSGFISDMVTSLAADHLNVILADTRTALGTNYAGNYADTLHPNKAGHLLMDTTIKAAIPAARVTGNSVQTLNSNVQTFAPTDAVSPAWYWSPNPNNRMDHGWGMGIKWWDQYGQTTFTSHLAATGLTVGFPNIGGPTQYCVYAYQASIGGYANSDMPPGALPAPTDCYFSITGNGAISFSSSPMTAKGVFSLNTTQNATVLPITINAVNNKPAASVTNTYSAGEASFSFNGTGTGARIFQTGVGNGQETACGVANKWFLLDFTSGTCVTEETVDSTGTHTFLKGIIVGPTTAPTCSASVAGQIQYTQGDASTKDVVQVCAHDSSNVYAWRAIY